MKKPVHSGVNGLLFYLYFKFRLFFGPPGLDCSFLFRTAERETEPKRKAAGLIPEAKNRIIFPKTSKRPPLRSGWTVLVSLRKNNPIFFTPRERGRNWIEFIRFSLQLEEISMNKGKMEHPKLKFI
jgi:hypothetical protein